MQRTIDDINRQLASFRTFRSRLKKGNNKAKLVEMDKRIRILTIDRDMLKLQQEKQKLLMELNMTEDEVYRSGSAIERMRKDTKTVRITWG